MSRWRNWIPFLAFAGLFGLALILSLYRPSWAPYLSFGLPIVALVVIVAFLVDKISHRHDPSAVANQGFLRWFRHWARDLDHDSSAPAKNATAPPISH